MNSKGHINSAKAGKPGYLYNSMRYHGIENFSVAVLDLCSGFSETTLRDWENFLIIVLKPTLNMTDFTTSFFLIKVSLLLLFIS